MTLQRLYLPIDGDDLDHLVAEGSLAAGALAYGVSPAFAAATPRADEEEREYLAFLDAVAAGAERAGPVRRVAILAIDLPESEMAWPASGTATTIERPVLRREAVSLHIGEEPGPEADLLWYDITEAGHVAGLLT